MLGLHHSLLGQSQARWHLWPPKSPGLKLTSVFMSVPWCTISLPCGACKFNKQFSWGSWNELLGCWWFFLLIKMHKNKQAHYTFVHRFVSLCHSRPESLGVSKILYAQLLTFCFFLNHPITVFPSTVFWVHFLFTRPHWISSPGYEICPCLPFLFPELLVITRALLKPLCAVCGVVFPLLTSPSVQKAVGARGTCPFSFDLAIASESFHLSKKIWRFDLPFLTQLWANYSQLPVLISSFVKTLTSCLPGALWAGLEEPRVKQGEWLPVLKTWLEEAGWISWYCLVLLSPKKDWRKSWRQFWRIEVSSKTWYISEEGEEMICFLCLWTAEQEVVSSKKDWSEKMET